MEVIVPSAVIFICFLHSQIVEDVQLRTEVVESKKMNTLGIQITDWSGIQMVQNSLISEWPAIQMVI